MKLRNTSEHSFSDISSEEVRIYIYPDKIETIEKPMFLSVSKSGGHRVLDADGWSHYMPVGWRHLKWRAKTGKPHFVQ